MRHGKKVSKKKRIRAIADIVIIFCLVIFLAYSVFNIFLIFNSYEKNQKKYEEIAESGVDFDALRKTNPDVVAWIRCEAEGIDYPIVQGDDNEKYLDTIFDGTYGDFGTLFVDYIVENPFKQFNTIVYGHHMKNGSMFGRLKKWGDEEFAKEHPSFELFLPDGSYDLMVWAFLNVPSTHSVYATNLEDDEIASYLKEVKKDARYTIGDVSEDDKLVVLSTCAYEYDGARYIVVGKMVKKEKKYRVIEPEPTIWDKIRHAIGM